MFQKTTLKNFVLMLMLFAGCVTAFAQSTWTGAVNTKWNTPGNWNPAVNPGAATNVTIPAGLTNYPLIDGLDGTADCANLTVEENASVTVTNGLNGNLRIYGTITNNGIIDATQGTVIMAGAVAQTIPAATFLNNSVRNLTIQHTTVAGTTTLLGHLDITGVLNVKTGTLNTGGFITFKSNASTTAMVAEINPLQAGIIGTVTAERYIPGKRGFRLFCASTTGGTINNNWQEGGSSAPGFGTHITGAGGASNGFDPTTTNNPSLFTHNNGSASWTAVANTTQPLAAGAAYRILVRGDRTIDLTASSPAATSTTLRSTGTLTVGDVLVTDLGMLAGDFNMVGNPYQAAIDMEAILNESTNLNQDFYWIWDPMLNVRGAYTAIVVSTNTPTVPGSAATKYARPNQAFFVQTESTGPASLTFSEDHKYVFSTATANVFSANDAANTAISLAMYKNGETDGPAIDGFMVRFGESYSNGVDSKDAAKPVNQDENVGLLNSGKMLAVESRAFPTANDVLQISNTTYRVNDYTYKITVNNLEGVTAYLHDNHTGESQELMNNGETTYNFAVDPTVESSTAPDRFSILFADALGIQETSETAFSIYPNPATGNGFVLQLASAENPIVEVYNQLGQKIACSTVTQGTEVSVSPITNMATGIYMVKVTAAGKSSVKKLIVK